MRTRIMAFRADRTLSSLPAIGGFLLITILSCMIRTIALGAEKLWRVSRPSIRPHHVDLELEHADFMDPVEFEKYVARLIAFQGFTDISTTPASGDLGVDIVANRNGFRYAIQIKRYARPVTRSAVSDVVGGMAAYDCSRAMVVTNNYFSPGAKKLARLNRCLIIDRDVLSDWVNDSLEACNRHEDQRRMSLAFRPKLRPPILLAKISLQVTAFFFGFAAVYVAMRLFI